MFILLEMNSKMDEIKTQQSRQSMQLKVHAKRMKACR
jgi:hypothetical protein